MTRAPKLLRFALLACVSSLFLSDVHADSGAAIEFEYAGCARIRPGPVCELGPRRELTLWAPGVEPLEVDGAGATRSVVYESTPIEGGVRARVRVAPGERALRLVRRGKTASLRVADSSESPQLQELARLWKAGKWSAVRALLDDPTPKRLAGGRERAFRARSLLRAGEYERSASELAVAAEEALRAGLLLDAGNDLLVAAYARAVGLLQYEQARSLLESVRKLDYVPELRAKLPYFLGIIANATGDAQRALVLFREASVLARRLGLDSDELLARQELAVTLNELHRDAEALAQQRDLVAVELDAPSCVLLQRWEKLAWFLLSQREPDLEHATKALDEVEQLLGDCPDPLVLRNQALNRVELDLKLGNSASAATRLAALRTDPKGRSAQLSAWEERYFGEVYLLQGATGEAIRAFERSEQLAESIDLRSCVYLARLGRARAIHRADGDALTAYAAAEDAADALVRWAPFGQGQQLTASATEQSSRELLSLLLERGRNEEAFSVAIRATYRAWAYGFGASRVASLSPASRRRWSHAVAEYRSVRRHLEQVSNDDWKLSNDGLSAVRHSRALEKQRLDNALATLNELVPHPVPAAPARSASDAHLMLTKGRDAWWALLAARDSLQTRRLAPVARSDLGAMEAIGARLASVLEEFWQHGDLSGATLRVILPPELAAFDVHALEVGGVPLVQRLPVAYVFAPGAPSERARGNARSASALIVANPNRDLRWAENEAREVATHFTAALPLVGEQASFAALALGLENARFLHFAGHGRAGGVDGTNSALLLNSGQELTLGDVLALEHVPEFVVLSACESTVSAEPGGAISIGQAFILAGSRVVVGASRTISDRVSERFAKALYTRLSRDPESGLSTDVRAWSEAIRAATLELKSEDPRLDWASIRLLLQ